MKKSIHFFKFLHRTIIITEAPYIFTCTSLKGMDNYDVNFVIYYAYIFYKHVYISLRHIIGVVGLKQIYNG